MGRDHYDILHFIHHVLCLVFVVDLLVSGLSVTDGGAAPVTSVKCQTK